MPKLASGENFIFLLQIIVILAFAKIFGEIARRFKQPAVIGEIVAGIVLGPTILGTTFPDIFHWLFLGTHNAGLALDGLIYLSIIFVLFVVGLEIDLDEVRSQGKSVAWLGSLGIVIPLVVGFPLGYALFPYIESEISRNLFGWFIGAALSISALPVIARILMDMNLLKTRLGTLIVAVSTINDVVGWLIFTFVLGLSGHSHGTLPVPAILGITTVLIVSGVTILPPIMKWLLRFVHNTFPSESGMMVTGVVTTLMLSCALLTEYIGVHAVFGAFLLGIAVNKSDHFSHETRKHIEYFTLHILAPLFFASVGLKVNFFLSFDFLPVIAILIAAYVSKVGAGLLGAKMARISKNDGIAVGLGIAARGGMGIILAIISYDTGLIKAPVFEALVIMAVITSMTSVFIKKFVPETRAK